MRRGSVKKRETSIWRRLIAVVLSIAMILCMFPSTALETKAEVTLRKPVIAEGSGTATGRKVTWDCIWFGNYPQTEIVAEPSQCGTYGNEYWGSEDDYEVNIGLYVKLQRATYDSCGDTTISGVKYRRIKKEDAVYVGEGSNYYSWSDSSTYHYFRYDPIKWRVLSIDGNSAFLLTDRVLDEQIYNLGSSIVTWETSAIRSWLNGYGNEYNTENFMDSAFSSAEQNVIKTTNVENKDNLIYGIDGGNNTNDKVFLLSESEVYSTDVAKSYGFLKEGYEYDVARRSGSSTYAKARGTFAAVYTETVGATSPVDSGNCYWWLRSPDYVGNSAIYASCDGYVFDYLYKESSQSNGVRAALNLDLSSNLWSYAGTVCSDGTDGTMNEGGSSGEGDDSENENSGGNISTDSFIKKCSDNIVFACPNLENLGTAELKGPELSLAGYKFNLFKTDVNMSLPFFNKNNIKIKIDAETKTAEVLLGIKEKELDTSDDDKYWTETYREVKSLVSACGGETDSTKLWNRFSKLRGKLKKLDANAVFKAKGNFAGYMKLQMNDDGTIQKILEGGMAAGFEANGSVKTPLWWIIYSEFKLGGSIDGKTYLTVDNTKSITMEGNVELAIKPSIALGADAVIVDVKGGIEGKIGGKVTFPWEEFKSSVTAYLTGKGFIKVNTIIPNLSGEFPYNFPKVELYPNLGKVTKTLSALQYDEPDPVTNQKIKSMTVNTEGAVDATKDALVYENAKPAMIPLADGTILMVYLDDTDGQAKLMYRIYNGSEWSEASEVYREGNLDTAGYLYSYGDKVYVIFESSSQKIMEDMSEDEIASYMNLYIAEYTEDGFSAPKQIGNTGTWKYDYQLAEHDGQLSAIWAENSDNDVMLTSGSTRIYESQLTNDSWGQATLLTEIADTITEAASGIVGDTFTIAYIKENQLYFCGKTTDIKKAIEDATRIDSPVIQNGKLYVRADGRLYSYDGTDFTDRKVECSTTYQIYDDSVYWVQQNNYNSEILCQTMDSDVQPVAITDEGGYVGGFTIVKNRNGKPLLSYTCQQVEEDSQEENPYGLTLLKSTENMTRYQAEVTNVAYDILSFTPGEKNFIDVTVCNTGTEEIHQTVLTIQDGDTVLYSDVVAEHMIAGETLECSVPVAIPENFAKENLTFSLKAAEDFKEDSIQSYEIETCLRDVEITPNGFDEVLVKNNALDTAKDVTIIVRNENEKGAEIRKILVGDLKSGESKKVSIQADWLKAVKDEVTKKKYLYCEVLQQGDEYELWNNSIVIERMINETKPSKTPASPSSVKIAGITLSGLSRQIAAGKKIKLVASVFPVNAANKAVTWKSSNTKVATVSASGIVTIKKGSGGKSVTITASATDGSGISASWRIKSMKGVVKKVSISGRKTVKAGKSLKLKAKVSASKGANKKLKWESNNTRYAKVSSAGKVTTYKAGKGKKVKITALTTDGSNKKKSVTIKIK